MKFLTTLLAFFVVGCATPINSYAPAAMDVSDPPLNQVVIRGVGEELLKQGRFFQARVLEVTAPVSVATLPGIVVWTISPGLYRFSGSDQEASYYRLGGFGEQSGTVTRAWLGAPVTSLMLKRLNNELCVIYGAFNDFRCGKSEPSSWREVKRNAWVENSIQQTLIYNGKYGDQIRIGYREFSHSYARPAFSNDVSYDLQESSLISYRGAMLEILEATNVFIRYKVIKNFNEAKSATPILPADPPEKKGIGA